MIVLAEQLRGPQFIHCLRHAEFCKTMLHLVNKKSIKNHVMKCSDSFLCPHCKFLIFLKLLNIFSLFLLFSFFQLQFPVHWQFRYINKFVYILHGRLESLKTLYIKWANKQTWKQLQTTFIPMVRQQKSYISTWQLILRQLPRPPYRQPIRINNFEVCQKYPD